MQTPAPSQQVPRSSLLCLRRVTSVCLPVDPHPHPALSGTFLTGGQLIRPQTHHASSQLQLVGNVHQALPDKLAAAHKFLKQPAQGPIAGSTRVHSPSLLLCCMDHHSRHRHEPTSAVLQAGACCSPRCQAPRPCAGAVPHALCLQGPKVGTGMGPGWRLLCGEPALFPD